MKTNINHVNIIDKLEVNKPISVEKICQEFFGITEINYLHNIHSKNIVVYIYTVNYSGNQRAISGAISIGRCVLCPQF